MSLQSLSGGPRYSTKVRMGNWSEDEARFALAAKDYEVRRSKGELLHLRRAREKTFQTQPSPHTYSADGCVHYGDTLMLGIDLERSAGKTTRYVLTDSIYSQVAPGAIRVSASAESHTPQVRNTFVIERPAAAAKSGIAGRSLRTSSRPVDDIVRYGDRVIIACNPALTVDPATKIVGLQYLLHSQRANNVTGAGRKGRQECTMMTTRNADAEWIVTDVNMDRDASDGEPVRLGEPVVLLHAMSNQALAANIDDTVPTDFGIELDIHVQTYKRAAHASMTHVGEMPATQAQPNNVWRFIGSDDPSTNDDRRGYKPLTQTALLERARSMIAAVCGFHGLRSLSLAFAALDEKGIGQIPAEYAKVAMIDHGVLQTDDEYAMLLAPFTSRGYVRPADIIPALRGDSFSAARREIVNAAYDSLLIHKAERLATLPQNTTLGLTVKAVPKPLAVPASAPDAISISELKLLYDGKFDVRVLQHSITAAEAAAEFARQWPLHQKPHDPVTREQFLAYYEDVSSGLVDDFEFVDMIANCWHVPGRGNWKAKAGKKVLVTFHKGSSAEVVVPECEDIADDDFEGLASALKGMGFGGIARVKVLGVVEAP